MRNFGLRDDRVERSMRRTDWGMIICYATVLTVACLLVQGVL